MKNKLNPKESHTLVSFAIFLFYSILSYSFSFVILTPSTRLPPLISYRNTTSNWPPQALELNLTPPDPPTPVSESVSTCLLPTLINQRRRRHRPARARFKSNWKHLVGLCRSRTNCSESGSVLSRRLHIVGCTCTWHLCRYGVSTALRCFAAHDNNSLLCWEAEGRNGAFVRDGLCVPSRWAAFCLLQPPPTHTQLPHFPHDAVCSAWVAPAWRAKWRPICLSFWLWTNNFLQQGDGR